MEKLEDIDIDEFFDKYIVKFLSNFPMIDITKKKISENESLISLKISEPIEQEYLINVKKVI